MVILFKNQINMNTNGSLQQKLPIPVNAQTQQMLRAVFAVGFVGFLAFNSFYWRTGRTDVIAYDTCIWDYFFDVFESQNKWFRQNLRMRDYLQASNSLLQDITFIMLFYYFGFSGRMDSTRVFWGMTFFGFLKI